MADAAQSKTNEAQALFPPKLAGQERNTGLITSANQVMVNTARAVWESEMELFRLESEQVAKTLIPLKVGSDPTAVASAYCEQWQEGSEKLLSHMRAVSDLVRKCGWDLFHIYQESFRDAAKPSQPR